MTTGAIGGLATEDGTLERGLCLVWKMGALLLQLDVKKYKRSLKEVR